MVKGYVGLAEKEGVDKVSMVAVATCCREYIEVAEKVYADGK